MALTLKTTVTEIVHCAECGFTSDELSLVTCPVDGAVLGETLAPVVEPTAYVEPDNVWV